MQVPSDSHRIPHTRPVLLRVLQAAGGEAPELGVVTVDGVIVLPGTWRETTEGLGAIP